MSFTIPNLTDAAFAPQAEPDSRDFDILAAADNLTGVVSGCAVTSTGAANGSLTVAAGVVRIGGRRAVVAGGTVAITANSSGNPRLDLVTVDTSGTLAAVAGTASAAPTFPTIPASRVVLTAMYVANGHTTGTTISATTITDKRVSLTDPGVENVVWYGATATGKTFTASATASSGTVTSQLTTPAGVGTSTATTGGQLAAATYSYRVSALNEYGETTASTGVTRVTTGTTSTVTVSWTAVPGAISYRIYGRASGSELLIATVGAPTVSWTDTGWFTPSGALPGSNTTGPFTSTMVGQSIYISGAGAAGVQYAGSISGFTSSSQVTVTPNASTTANNVGAAAGTDDTTAINAAIAQLANGSTLFFPNAGFLHTGLTVANKSDVSITGNYGTLICSNEATQVLLVSNCARVSVERLRITHATQTARNSAAHGVRFIDCVDLYVGSNLARATCGTGFFLENNYRGTIVGNTVLDTLADGIHCTLRCSDIDVIGNRLFGTGDDAIAFVSYQKDGSQVTRCTATGNTVFNSKARGIAVVGSTVISVVSNSINSTKAAGVIISQENGFSTFGPSQVSIASNTIKAANTYSSPSVSHAGILVSGDSTTYVVDDIHIVGNTISNSWRRDIFAVPSVTGSVTNLIIENNGCYGPSVQTGATAGESYAQIELYQVDSAIIRGNTVDKAQRHGILVPASVAYCTVQGNTITSPNQENIAATSYGIYCIAAASTVTPDNIVRRDGAKAALVRDVWVGVPTSDSGGGPLVLRDANTAPTNPVDGMSIFSSSGSPVWLSSGGAQENMRGWEFLASTVLGGAAVTTGAITVAARDELLIVFRVVSVSSSDTVGLRFNGDTGNNYWWRGITSVKTATSGSAPAFVDTFLASTSRILVYPLAGTTQITGHAIVTNRSATTKVAAINSAIGSAAAATVPTTMVFGAGEWINTAAQITSVTMLSTGGAATLATGSGFVVFGRNL